MQVKTAKAAILAQSREPLVVDEIALPGAHNRANAMATAAVCLARGIERDAVAQALRTFTGVAHRLETIAVRDGVSYVNDSKATNVASAIVALESYDRGVHLIAGGRGKNQDFSGLAEPEARYKVATRDPGSTPVSMTVTPGICEPVAAYTWTTWPRPARPRARSFGDSFRSTISETASMSAVDSV